jgi:hypothetical protein
LSNKSSIYADWLKEDCMKWFFCFAGVMVLSLVASVPAKAQWAINGVLEVYDLPGDPGWAVSTPGTHNGGQVGNSNGPTTSGSGSSVWSSAYGGALVNPNDSQHSSSGVACRLVCKFIWLGSSTPTDFGAANVHGEVTLAASTSGGWVGASGAVDFLVGSSPKPNLNDWFVFKGGWGAGDSYNYTETVGGNSLILFPRTDQRLFMMVAAGGAGMRNPIQNSNYSGKGKASGYFTVNGSSPPGTGGGGGTPPGGGGTGGGGGTSGGGVLPIILP